MKRNYFVTETADGKIDIDLSKPEEALPWVEVCAELKTPWWNVKNPKWNLEIVDESVSPKPKLLTKKGKTGLLDTMIKEVTYLSTEWLVNEITVRTNFDVISEGYHYLTGCRIKTICGDAVVFCTDCEIDLIAGHAQVININDCSVDNITEHAVVKRISGKSCIDIIDGFSEIYSIEEKSIVYTVKGAASIGFIAGYSVIKEISDRVMIGEITDNAEISSITDTCVVKKMMGASDIAIVTGDARIYEMDESASIGFLQWNASVKSMTGRSIVKTIKGMAVITSMDDRAYVIAMEENSVIQYMKGYSKINSMTGGAVISIDSIRVRINRMSSTAAVVNCVSSMCFCTVENRALGRMTEKGVTTVIVGNDGVLRLPTREF